MTGYAALMAKLAIVATMRGEELHVGNPEDKRGVARLVKLGFATVRVEDKNNHWVRATPALLDSAPAEFLAYAEEWVRAAKLEKESI